MSLSWASTVWSVDGHHWPKKYREHVSQGVGLAGGIVVEPRSEDRQAEMYFAV